jgi:hypothetical protein
VAFLLTEAFHPEASFSLGWCGQPVVSARGGRHFDDANPTVSQPGETLESMREAGIGIAAFWVSVRGRIYHRLVSVEGPLCPRQPVGRKELSLRNLLRQQREWVAAQRLRNQTLPKDVSFISPNLA